MELKEFNMLKNIEISKYFNLIKHEMMLDDKLWKRDNILSNMGEGFEIIKCTSSVDCNNPAVAITKIKIKLFLLLNIIINLKPIINY